MIFKQLGQDIWELNRPFGALGIELGHRMTVVRLTDGTLWVHSPVALDDEVRDSLAKLGEVSCFVAPSTFHDLYWPSYFEAYPDALFHCAQGVKEEHRDLPFHETLSDSAPSLWESEFEQLTLAGIPKANEVVFLHRPSRSLIVADMVFNIGRETNFLSRLTFRMAGVYAKVAVSRFYRLFFKDKTALRRSVDRVLEWEFDRIVVGHGNIVEADATEALGRAYAFLKQTT